MGRTLLAFAAAFALLLAAVAVLLTRGTTLGFATPWIERLASDALGRELRMAAPLRLKLDSGLRLEVSEITLANAEWAAERPLASLEYAAAVIDIRSLLSDTVSIKTLQLNGLDVQLLISSEGKSNVPALPATKNDKQVAEAETPSLPFVIHDSHIRDVRVERENRQVGVQALMVIETMTLEASGENDLELAASGWLQDRAWQLSVTGTGVRSLLAGKNLEGDIRGSLGELNLTGNYQVPDMDELGNLTLNSTLTGKVPARVAELSPLLVADEPIELRLTLSDSDPGLDIDLFADLENLDAHVIGSVARPKSLDGLNLSLSLDSKSLPMLSTTFGLGETPDVPLQLSAQLLRDGRRIEATELTLQAGAHQLAGSAVLPAFPDTDNALIDLHASGPDFSFYQRLLKRPVSFPAPYSLNMSLSSHENSAEILGGEAHIGNHQVTFSGELNNYPDYRDSALRFDGRSPSIQAIGAALNLQLPDAPARLSGELSVLQGGMVTVDTLRADLLGVSAQLSGELGSYPDMHGLDLALSAELASLAATSEHLRIAPLGDLPVSFSLTARGNPSDITVSDISVGADGLAIESKDGALRLTTDGISTDMELAVQVENLPRLLGSYAPAGIPGGTFRFDFLTRVTDEHVELSIARLSGPGLSGTADARFSRDFSFDDNTRLSVELRITDLTRLLPDIPDYTAAEQPLLLRVLAQPEGEILRFKAQLHDETRDLLTANASIPKAETQQPIRILLSGRGQDLRLLGRYAALPDRLLPYAIDAEATIEGEHAELSISKLELAGSQMLGSAQLDRTARRVTADLQIPSAELTRWLKTDDSQASTSSTGAKSDTTEQPVKGRLIPDYTLPLDLLESYAVDLRLRTGPLGLSVPNHRDESLIDMLELQMTSRNGQATLEVTEASGSLGSLQGKVSVATVDGKAAFESAMTLADFPLAVFAGGSGFSRLPRHSLVTEFRAEGSTLRELAATLTGDFLLSGGAGSLGRMKFSFATESFVAQLFQTLLPMLNTADPNVQVECTVLAARADQGVVHLDPGFVLRSKRVDLTARGDIDLRSERLRIRFDNQARKGLGISAASLINPYLEITGTLAKPSIGIDVKNSALSGGAAIATGGLTVLAKPLFGRIMAFGNPCKTALERWEESGP